jgi:hypothetical protein
MSYNHVNVTLTPGQIKRLQSASNNNCGITISLTKEHMSGSNKLSLTDRQFKNFNKAKKSNKGVKLDLSAAAIKDTFKTGGIFPLLAAIPALIAAAAPAVAKAAALGAVGTAAGMALKKATGQGIKRTSKKKGKGLRLPGTPPSWYGKGLRLPGTVY